MAKWAAATTKEREGGQQRGLQRRGQQRGQRRRWEMPHLINPLDDCSVPLVDRKEHVDYIEWLHSLGLLECGQWREGEPAVGRHDGAQDGGLDT